MMQANRVLQPEEVFSRGPIIPVLVIQQLDDALPLASALIGGGITVLEITLRTPCALEAIRLMRGEFPDILIGAGTVTTPRQLEQCVSMGAQFALSPGLTKTVLEAGKNSTIPFIPGIASVSELMEGLELGFNHFKFFPAEVAGGVKMLSAISGPFPEVRFCPTGGIHEKNYMNYLNLPNVSCVGGSWIVPAEALYKQDWQRIQKLASTVLEETGERSTRLSG